MKNHRASSYRRSQRAQRERLHLLYRKSAALTEIIIGSAIEVHRDKGPGLVESIHEWCLTKELEIRRLGATNQKMVRITYKGFTREEPLRFDLLVEDCVLIETKSVEQILPIHKAQLLGCVFNLPCRILNHGCIAYRRCHLVSSA